MKTKKIFKEIEMHVANINDRYYIDTEDLEKVIYDLLFAKVNLDQKTARTIQYLSASIRKTYKALLMTDKFDINDETALIELSRNKVKKLVKKSVKKASKTLSDEEMELEDLSTDDNYLILSQEAIEEFITTSLTNELSPLKNDLAKLEDLITNQEKGDLKLVSEPTPTAKKAKKTKAKKQASEDDIESAFEDNELSNEELAAISEIE